MLVIRELTMTYHQPVVGLSEVDVHFWVERAGRTSVTYRFQVLSADHGAARRRPRVVVNLDGRPCARADRQRCRALAAPLLGPGVAEARRLDLPALPRLGRAVKNRCRAAPRTFDPASLQRSV